MSDKIVQMGPQGWECPKCHSVMAPWVAECPHCNGMQWPGGPAPTTGPSTGDPLPKGPTIISMEKTVRHQEELVKAGQDVN